MFLLVPPHVEGGPPRRHHLHHFVRIARRLAGRSRPGGPLPIDVHRNALDLHSVDSGDRADFCSWFPGDARRIQDVGNALQEKNMSSATVY